MADALSELLQVAGISASLISRARLAAPFGVDSGDVGRAVFHAPKRGRCWLATASTAPVEIGPGDIVVLPRGTPHDITHAPGAPTRALQAHRLDDEEGLPTVSNDGSPDLDLLCGTFRFGEPANTWLVAPLPDVMVVRGGDDVSTFVEATLGLTETELVRSDLGSQLVCDRLVEIFVIHLFRAWARSSSREVPCWLAGLADPHVGRAMAAVHASPAEGWDLPRLARVAGLSRTRFVARFRNRVGIPPGEFVQSWRIAVARRALRDGAAVAEAASEAGYASEASFARAFKRLEGLSPAAWRSQSARLAAASRPA